MIKDLITSQTCCYVTLWNLRVLKFILLLNAVIRNFFLEQFCAAHFKLHGSYNLWQLTMFWLICVTVNIQNVLIWLECRHGYICTTGHAMVSSITLCSTPVHTSIRRCLKSHPVLLSSRLVAELYPRWNCQLDWGHGCWVTTNLA